MEIDGKFCILSVTNTKLEAAGRHQYDNYICMGKI